MHHTEQTDWSERLARILSLRVSMDAWSTRRLELRTRSGWRRVTTALELEGAGHVGRGEHAGFDPPREAWWTGSGCSGLIGRLHGVRTMHEWSLVARGAPSPSIRWTLESAAVSLASAQAGLSLEELLGRPRSPVRYVVSLGLGCGPGLERLHRLRRRDPRMRFKLDLIEPWSETRIVALQELGGIDVVDAKRACAGDQAHRPTLERDDYERLGRAFPGGTLEDPPPAHEAVVIANRMRVGIDRRSTVGELERALERLGADASVNLKPSRLGSWRSLWHCFQAAERSGASTRVGGAFEIGPGRRQLARLAACLTPDAPNDVAPAALHVDSNAVFSPSPALLSGPF